MEIQFNVPDLAGHIQSFYVADISGVLPVSVGLPVAVCTVHGLSSGICS